MFCLLQKEGGKRRSKGEFILKTKKAPEKNSPTMRYKEEKKNIKIKEITCEGTEL